MTTHKLAFLFSALMAVLASSATLVSGCTSKGSATVADLSPTDPFGGTGGDLWRHVRRIGSDPMPSSPNYFFPEQDNLTGIITYGSFPYPSSKYSWSIPFGDYDQLLFVTGDRSAWMVMNRDELFDRVGGLGTGAVFAGYTESSPRCVLLSHTSSSPYSVGMEFDYLRPEHPYVYFADSDHTSCMYGELNRAYPLPLNTAPASPGASWPVEAVVDDATRSTQAREHGGINIYVRKAVASCTTNNDCSDGINCNGAEVCTAGSCGPGTHTCGGGICDESTDQCISSFSSCASSLGPGTTADLNPNDILNVNGAQGWTLVRRIGSLPIPGRSVDRYFPINDELMGKVTHGYPDTVDPSVSSTTWSIPFPEGWNQVLFRTGDGKAWMVMNKAELYNKAGGDATSYTPYSGNRCVLMSHLSSTPYAAFMYLRRERLEDPWWSYSNVYMRETTLYGEYNPRHGVPVPGAGVREPDWHLVDHAYQMSHHNGVNVYVRIAPGPGGVVGGCFTNNDCIDSLYCNGQETCSGGRCQAGTPPACSANQICNDIENTCTAVNDCPGSAYGKGTAADITGPTQACTIDPRETGLGGWQHVRRIGAGIPLDSSSFSHGADLSYMRTYYPGDNMAGAVSTAPDVPDEFQPLEWSHSTWSYAWPTGWNQALFITSDGASWIVMNKNEIFNDATGTGSLTEYAGEPRCVLRSHLRCHKSYTVIDYFRNARGEDPILGYLDLTGAPQRSPSTLYMEYSPVNPTGGNPGAGPAVRQLSTGMMNHAGVNVYVRRACIDDTTGEDAGCLASAPFCFDGDSTEANGGEGICVECLSHLDCDPGEYCGSEHKCGVCLDDKVGDVDLGCTVGICPGVLDDADMSTAPSCVPECTSNQDCPAPPPRDASHRLCDVARGLCVVCLDTEATGPDLGCVEPELENCDDGGKGGDGGGSNTCMEFVNPTCYFEDTPAGTLDGVLNPCPKQLMLKTQMTLALQDCMVEDFELNELAHDLFFTYLTKTPACAFQTSLTRVTSKRRQHRHLLQLPTNPTFYILELNVYVDTYTEGHAILDIFNSLAFQTFVDNTLEENIAASALVVRVDAGIQRIWSATSDPHFVTLSGDKFDFNGVAGGSYCIVSDARIQINARFLGAATASEALPSSSSSSGSGGGSSIPPDARTWMGQLAIMHGSDRILIDAASPAGTPYVASIGSLLVNGEPMLQRTSLKKLPSGVSVLRKKTRVTVTVPGVAVVEVEVVRASFWEAGAGPGRNFLNLHVQQFNGTEAAHGVLGQSFASRGSVPLAGSVDEYATSDIFAADCRFNRFTEGLQDE